MNKKQKAVIAILLFILLGLGGVYFLRNFFLERNSTANELSNQKSWTDMTAEEQKQILDSITAHRKAGVSTSTPVAPDNADELVSETTAPPAKSSVSKNNSDQIPKEIQDILGSLTATKN